MSLIIPDMAVLGLIAVNPHKKIPKTTHRWPSGQTSEGYMCMPKMSIGSQHKVYEHAPHGRYGNELEPPLLIVEIEWIVSSMPAEWTDEEMLHEGFTDLYTYGIWWDMWRQGHRNCKYWDEMQGEPFWVCGFRLVGATDYFWRRLEQYGRERGLIGERAAGL